MLRSTKGLQLNRTQMPESKIRRLWRALDEDSSGYIDAGEFGRFMKKGEAGESQVEKARRDLLASRAASSKALRAESDARVGRDLSHSLAGLEPASEEEVGALAEQVSAKMPQLLPMGTERAWIKLFKLLNEDGTGRLSFAEFSKLVRTHLGMGKTELAEERLCSIWKSIDGAGAGFCSVGAFGRFIKKGSAVLAQQSAALDTEDETNRRKRVGEEERAARRIAAKKEEDERMRAASRQTAARAQQLEIDAARLEAELKRVARQERAGHQPLTGLRRLKPMPNAPLAPLAPGDAQSPLPGGVQQYTQQRSGLNLEARTLDFQPKVGFGVDF